MTLESERREHEKSPYQQASIRKVCTAKGPLGISKASSALQFQQYVFILAGLLARLQGYGKNEQRKAVNDALIFLTAAKSGCVVLTRNLSDFDLLMQLDPRGQAVFYELSEAR